MRAAAGLIADSYNAPSVGMPTTGLGLWLDADDASTFTYSSGAVVSEWRDKSSFARHMIQTTVAAQPIRNGTLNGRSTVVFDGTDDWMYRSAAYTLSQPLTVFIVVRPISGTTGDETQAFLAAYGGNFQMAANAADGPLLHVYCGAPELVSTHSITGFHIWRVVANGATSSIYCDGLLSKAGALGTSQPTTTGLMLSLERGFGSYPIHGDVCEVLVYERALSAGEITSAETYLTDKWKPEWMPPTVSYAPFVHYDAAAAGSVATNPGGLVTQWKDLTANARHLDAGPAKPLIGTRIANGRDTIEFQGDAAAQYLRYHIGSNLLGFSTYVYTSFVVASSDAAQAGDRAMALLYGGTNDYNSAGAVIFLMGGDAAATCHAQVYSGGGIAKLGTAGPTPFGVWSIRRNVPSTWEFRSPSATLATGTGGAGHTDNNGILVGGRWMSTSVYPATFLDGTVAAVLVYPGLLSVADHDKIRDWLIARWGTTVSAPFLPSQLTSLQLWLDASDAASITASAGAVSQWNDKSGLARHAVQATAANKPTTGTVTQNGKNVLAHDGADWMHATSDPTIWKFIHDGTPTLIGAVWNPGPSGSSRGLLGNHNEAGGGQGLSCLAYNSATGIALKINSTGAVVNHAGPSQIVYAAPNVTTILLDPANSIALERSKVGRNAGVLNQVNAATGAVGTADPSRPLVVGGLASSLTAAATPIGAGGWLAELVIASGADATEANRVKLRNYLNQKWAVY